MLRIVDLKKYSLCLRYFEMESGSPNSSFLKQAASSNTCFALGLPSFESTSALLPFCDHLLSLVVFSPVSKLIGDLTILFPLKRGLVGKSNFETGLRLPESTDRAFSSSNFL